MAEVDSFVRDVEQAIASGDSERRTRSMRKLTELFVEQSSKLNETHVAVFDEVLVRLARDADAMVRGDLSASLADIGNAPVNTVKDLAFDGNAKVAKPVLERSARITEDDLVEIAAKRAQDHLLAIARRPSLSERVTETLVSRGDQRVVHAVAENTGAKFSEKGLDVLIEKANGNLELQETLQKRGDVPLERLRLWTGKAAAQKAVQAPKAASSADMCRMEAAMAELAASIKNGSLPPPRDVSAALKHMAKLARGKPIDEVRVVAWIKAKRTEDALAAIAHNARLPGETVARAYEAAAYEPLLLMVRAARFNWNTFKLLLTHKIGTVPSADVVKTSFEVFQQVPVEAAYKLAASIAPAAGGKQSDAA